MRLCSNFHKPFSELNIHIPKGLGLQHHHQSWKCRRRSQLESDCNWWKTSCVFFQLFQQLRVVLSFRKRRFFRGIDHHWASIGGFGMTLGERIRCAQVRDGCVVGHGGFAGPGSTKKNLLLSKVSLCFYLFGSIWGTISWLPTPNLMRMISTSHVPQPCRCCHSEKCQRQLCWFRRYIMIIYDLYIHIYI